MTLLERLAEALEDRASAAHYAYQHMRGGSTIPQHRDSFEACPAEPCAEARDLLAETRGWIARAAKIIDIGC